MALIRQNNFNNSKQYGLVAKCKVLQKVTRFLCRAVVIASLGVISSENSAAWIAVLMGPFVPLVMYVQSTVLNLQLICKHTCPIGYVAEKHCGISIVQCLQLIQSKTLQH